MPPTAPTRTVRTLTRGGTVVTTAAGLIQFGIPPETIKDTMREPGGVPGTFVALEPLFEPNRGVSLCELEFPIYFNFFVLRRRTRVVCTAEQKARITLFVKEATFGPEKLNLAGEFLGGLGNKVLPDLRKEMDHFRRNPFKAGARTTLSDLIVFSVFDRRGRVELPDDITLAHDASEHVYRVLEGEDEVASVPDTVTLPPPRRTLRSGRVSRTPFYPPLFGVTVIGSGHGFDPKADTSGFILWVNHRGIIVDPPVDSTEWLHERHVPRKLVNALILTHCHADHDAGTLQKLFQEQKIPIYTSRTIMEAFVRKASAITGLTPTRIRSLVDYHPIAMGLPVRINGAEFSFSYTLHSIPALGFEVYFLGKSFVYSGDTLNDPAEIDRLQAAGVLSKGRHDALLDFPWHHNLIFHEAGVPPLHTPASRLAALPDSVKRRLFVLHVGKDSVPPDSQLRVAKPGLPHTLRIHVEKGPNSRSVELLTCINGCELFRSFPLNRAADFLGIVRTERFAAGTVVLHENEVGSKFYLIMAGHASIVSEGRAIDEYGPGDYFGETAVVMDMPRTADVVATTDLTCIVLEKADFLYFIRGTDVALKLRRLFINRQLGLSELLLATEPFRNLSATQRTHLESYMDADFAMPGQRFIEEGTKADRVYVITEGEVQLSAAGRPTLRLGPDTFLADVDALLAGGSWSFSAEATDNVRLFVLLRKDLLDFLDLNPGFYFKLAEHTGR